jgi:hypothetical protein
MRRHNANASTEFVAPICRLRWNQLREHGEPFQVGDAIGDQIAFQRSLPVVVRRAHRPAPDSNFWITTATSLALVSFRGRSQTARSQPPERTAHGSWGGRYPQGARSADPLTDGRLPRHEQELQNTHRSGARFRIAGF